MNKYITFRNKSGSISFQINKKTMLVFFSLVGLTLLTVVISLSIGSTMINPLKVFKHLVGAGSGEYTFIIDSLRLPRIILALFVGAALGVSGLILQGIIHNPLASPDIIGITGGASAAAVLFISLFSGILSIRWLPVAAILGAGAVSLLIYFLSWKNGINPLRLVLIGIGIAAAMNALTTLIIVFSPITTTQKAYTWLTGSVYGASWGDVYSILPWIVIFIPFAQFFSRTLNVQEFEEQVARGLGLKVQLHRFSLLFISVALAGSAVAFAGGIGFVGLIAPHISRKLVGRSFAGLIPVSAMTGGLIVVLADLIARTIFLPLDLPAGVLVSGIGAPFFIYLLYRNRNSI